MLPRAVVLYLLSALAAVAAGPARTSLHSIHAPLECNMCHVPVSKGSVVLQRPGHKQCMLCHADAFRQASTNPRICASCHESAAPGAADLFAYPRYEKQRTILTEFSHARHVDTLARVDARTGFRADCAFCHHFDEQGITAAFPRHPQCAACHSKAGMHPVLSATSTKADCRGCHVPEQIENPGPANHGRAMPAYVPSGTYSGIKFSHIAHFRDRQGNTMNCTACHAAMLTSTSLATQTLPTMVDCMACHHQSSKTVPVAFRLSNCQTCHVDRETGPAPSSHTRDVRPAFHTESFRVHHEVEAAAPDAKCFVCHTNVAASGTAKNQCLACHQVMRPVSHSARWRDDIHGKYAAIDRQSCATCHTTDYCSRCHNELPRSHIPLALFKNGGHARLAMLNERSCLTCHTVANTCAECHAPARR